MRTNRPVTDQEHLLADDEVIVSRTDAAGRITYPNEAFVRISGFAREELLGQPHNIVRHPDMPQAAFADLWQTILQGQPWSGVVKNRRKDGGFYWVRAMVTPIVEAGSITGYLSVRVKPTRAEVEAAVALYAAMRAGTLRGVRLQGGELVRTGWVGRIVNLLRLPLTIRFGLIGAAQALLFGALAALALWSAAGIDAGVWLAALAGAGVLLSLAVTVYTTALIGRPLEAVTRAAVRIAGGDIRSRFPQVGDQGVQQLTRMLNRMNAGLVGVMMDANRNIESMRAATEEVSRGNLDLSSRTEQQAASLQQTAASMEELSATVKHNADSARQASQLASAAGTVAAKGGAVVAQVVRRMQEISASSQRIAEIIGVIDGIAFQTNILALNAAVEAARAGEQGRGFAVVAGEVRSLAQRSAQAAREIKGLITNSVTQVESGCALVNDAGRTMEELVAQVKRVTDLIGEIASATQQQAGGIGQVNQAVTQLDQMTQQNAALVEQSAAAAESLREQADRLAEAVAMFSQSRHQATSAIARAQSASRPARPSQSPARPSAKPTPRSAAAATPAGADWQEF